MRTILALVLALALLVVPAAFAEPVGATVTGTTQLPGYEITAGQVNVNAGYITEMNIEATQLTDYWAGIVGQITGGKAVLGTGNNVFFDWTLSSASATTIYFATASSVDWSTLGGGVTTSDINAAIYSAISQEWTPTADENFEATFSNEDSGQCDYVPEDGGGVTASYVTVPKGLGYWTVCAFKDGSGNVVFTSNYSSQTWAGNTYHFGVLVPAVEGAAMTYYVFTE